MNNKISLWISGNQRRSGYTPILSVYQPPFSYPGYDERKGMQSSDFYFVVRTTDEYTQYTLIHNKITTSDGYPNAILKIAIGIPAGMCIKHDKSPYEVLIAVKDAFVREYMTPTYGVEGGFSFTDKIVTEDIFVKILDSYELIGDSSSQKVMRGTSAKTVFTEEVSRYLKTFRLDNDLESLGELVVAEGTNSTTVEAPHKTQAKTVTPQSEDYKPIPPKPRNFKNIIIAFLAVVVICQGAYLLRNNINDDQNIIEQSPEVPNEVPSAQQEVTEAKTLDSIDSLAINIRKSLDNEYLPFAEIETLYKEVKETDLVVFKKRCPKLDDTLNVYNTFREKLVAGNIEGALKFIFGEDTTRNYKIYRKFGNKQYDLVCSTNFERTYKFDMFREKHQIIIANYFVGKEYNPQTRTCQSDSVTQRANYSAAYNNKDKDDWHNFKIFKDNAIK